MNLGYETYQVRTICEDGTVFQYGYDIQSEENARKYYNSRCGRIGLPVDIYSSRREAKGLPPAYQSKVVRVELYIMKVVQGSKYGSEDKFVWEELLLESECESVFDKIKDKYLAEVRT